MVSYIKGRIQTKGIWKQDPEANICAQEGWEWGVEKAPQWGTSKVLKSSIIFYWPKLLGEVPGYVNNERPTGQKQQLLDGGTVENKSKLILTEIFPSVQKYI